MDKLTNKKALLESIRISEKSGFEYNENAILEEYKLQGENTASLAIKILSIFGGFLAMLAFLCFLAIGGLYDSELGLLLFGIAFIITAILLNKKYDKLLIDTFSISIYIAGFVLFYFGLAQFKISDNFILILMILIAFISLSIVQSYILSFISVITISYSLLAIILSNNLVDLIHIYIAFYAVILGYIFLNEVKIISSYQKFSKLYNPIRIGLIFSFLFGLIAIGKRGLVAVSESYIWLSSIVLFLVVFYLVKNIIKINEVTDSKNKISIYILTALVLIPTLFSPSISGAIIIILLSFLVNYKSGFVIGIISLIYFVSQYYYDLSFTLLTKSILLFSSGIVFIFCYLIISKNTKIDEKI